VVEVYEAHGWCGLAETTFDAGKGTLDDYVAELCGRIATVNSDSLAIDVRRLNGGWFLTLTCHSNRRRGEALFIDELLQWIADRLPGSWGLIHDRDDDGMPEPYGPNNFRVRVLARGSVSERLDSLLSPARPKIED
jgi:hypothetical protein